MSTATHTVLVNESGNDALQTEIIEAMQSVYDPEIPVNIYDLGLIYVLEIREDQSVYCRMTLTAPNCPAAGILPGQVEAAIGTVEGVTDVNLELTFDPPFTVEMMSDEAKLALGML